MHKQDMAVRPIDPDSELGRLLAERNAGFEQTENMEGRPDAMAPAYQNPGSYPPLGPMGGALPSNFGKPSPNAGQPICPGWAPAGSGDC